MQRDLDKKEREKEKLDQSALDDQQVEGLAEEIEGYKATLSEKDDELAKL